MIFPIPPFSAIGSAYRISDSLNSCRMGIENLPAATSYASCSSLERVGLGKDFLNAQIAPVGRFRLA